MKKEPTLIVLTGPTASGKSALAVSLAKELQTEIISADSRQIYKGIPIVTAVPTKEERQGVNHYLIETLPLDAYYSSAAFQEDADKILNRLFQKYNTAIVCGGSMMYLDALINGIDNLPTVPAELRESLMKEWKNKGDGWLLEKLRLTDPLAYFRTDLRNLKRVFHALEVSVAAGVPYSSLLSGRLKEGKRELPFKVIKFCLDGKRDILFERINERVVKMMEKGLEEEAQKVYPFRHLNSLNTVGLKEMFEMFEGKLTREEATARIQKNTRVYAKKQHTWHKRDTSLTYLDFTDTNQDNIKQIIKYL